MASIADFLAMDTTAVSTEHPASIADFPAMEAPPPSPNRPAADVSESYQLPPIEHFIDTIGEERASDGGEYGFEPDDPFAELPLPLTSDEYGWEETDWQRYDWRSAAALGEAGDPAAISAWAQTDWENPASAARDARESAAQAIADALDGIARRIREGDLVIPQPPAAVPDPATIAATLAALLGVRR